jgi:hypothetical protein
MLPARWWSALDRVVPATRAALASSVVTVIGGGISGVAGFVAYAQHHAGAVNDAILTSPGAVDGDVTTLTLQAASAVSAFGFFVTPQGIAAIYLTLSGVARVFAVLFGEGSGDLVLTGIDHLSQRLGVGMATRHRRRSRETREGPEVPDQILRGAHAGLDADLVIVSARPKTDWDQGTIVHAADRWYRVGAVEERTIRGYLRTLYPLREIKDHAVFRRQVEYEIPARYVQGRGDE